MTSVMPEANSNSRTARRKPASLRWPNNFRPTQGAEQQNGQSDDKQPHRVCRQSAARAQPQGAHCKDRDADRLKDGTLLVPRPSTHATPDYGQNAREASDAPEDAIGEPNAAVGRRATALHRLHCRSHEAVDAEKDKDDADTGAHDVRSSPS